MFDQTKKYKNNGHFFFQKGDRLSDVSSQVPELSGVYYILRLSKGKIDLVYIGKSGTVTQAGTFKDQLLRGRINNKQEGMKRQDFFYKKLFEDKIDALDIYWFVTIDEVNTDLPGYVEGLLIQRYFHFYGKLPLWNKDF
jgi:hypothetical protein